MRLGSFWNKFLLGGLAVTGVVSVSSAKADDWACELALCLANPAGATAVPQCVPPITKLHKHLAKGRSFPLCKSSDGHVKFTRYSKVELQQPPRRTKPSYLEYVVQGKTSRIWW